MRISLVSVTHSRFCPHCGDLYAHEAAFCTECGEHREYDHTFGLCTPKQYIAAWCVGFVLPVAAFATTMAWVLRGAL